MDRDKGKGKSIEEANHPDLATSSGGGRRSIPDQWGGGKGSGIKRKEAVARESKIEGQKRVRFENIV